MLLSRPFVDGSGKHTFRLICLQLWQAVLALLIPGLMIAPPDCPLPPGLTAFNVNEGAGAMGRAVFRSIEILFFRQRQPADGL